MGTGLMKSEDDRIGTSQNMPVQPRKHSQMNISSPRSMHSPLVQLTKSHDEILAVGDGVGRMDVENGPSKASVLETKNIIEDVGIGIEVRSRLMNVEVSSGISQNSPVHPVKHSQVKFAPRSRGTQLPLLQSVTSHMFMSVGGLGEGERVSTMDEDKTMGTSQNIPVHPG